MANACTVSAVGVLRVPRVRRGDTFEIGSCLKCPSVVLLWDLKIGPISKAESATGHDLSKSPAATLIRWERAPFYPSGAPKSICYIAGPVRHVIRSEVALAGLRCVNGGPPHMPTLLFGGRIGRCPSRASEPLSPNVEGCDAPGCGGPRVGKAGSFSLQLVRFHGGTGVQAGSHHTLHRAANR